MANIKTDISLSKALLEEVETVAREMKISRSRLLVLAIRDFLRRHQTRRLVEQINQAYQDGPDEEEREWLEQARHSYRRLLEKNEW
jgi:metal-responsive CopG/Arc/MetJ family transcriptional regulator